MPSLKKIVCLANSWKFKERCVAGIDLLTGRWIRPVCDRLYPENGKVPKLIRCVNGREPELLDILEIPLADTGNDFGFEWENLSVLEGEWSYCGKAKPSDVLKYCGNFRQILHNTSKYVNPSYLRSLPFPERRTLQLVQVSRFTAEQKVSSKGNHEWRGTIQSVKSGSLREAKITDPVLVEKSEMGYQPKNNCLVTVSLSMPWVPPN